MVKNQMPRARESKTPVKELESLNPTIRCDLCKKEFSLGRESLIEKKVNLYSDFEMKSKPHEVLMTSLFCPHCGKNYPVIIDNEESLLILGELRETMSRRLKFASKGKPIPSKLNEKYKKLTRKLGIKRQKMAEIYNGSFYQTEDGKEQLDYRYHVR